MKAIETKYKGYKFRSRLEARWAVFFNSMEVEFEYEPQGFKLSSGKLYLPDFYLPKDNMWVEVKGKIEKELLDDLIDFAADEESNKIMLLGAIPDPPDRWMGCLTHHVFQSRSTVESERNEAYFDYESHDLIVDIMKYEQAHCFSYNHNYVVEHFLGFFHDGRVVLTDHYDTDHNGHCFFDPTMPKPRKCENPLHRWHRCKNNPCDDGDEFKIRVTNESCCTINRQYSSNERFLMHCYDKARQARFEHGENG